MSIWDGFLDNISRRIAAHVIDMQAVSPIVTARAYRQGYQRDQLKVKQGQFDDNLALNMTGLIEARIVSQLFGKGIELDFEGDTETEQEQYIKAVLDANKQEILFHRCALSAGEAGTGYLMIIPDGMVGNDGVTYPRLQLIDPLFVRMETLPEDYELVIRYIIEYKYEENGKEKRRRRTIQHTAPVVDAEGATMGGNTWEIVDEVMEQGGRWEVVNRQEWPYDFAPIIHWQNLPSVSDCHGEPDITGSLLELQDRINFLASNISKLIRYYAHTMRIYKGNGKLERLDVGPDQMVKIGIDEDVIQLDPLGDLASSLTFLDSLTKSMYTTARVVDLSSYEDKLGSLTNFGLRVLYQDNLSMIATKRELFGDMLEELVRRLLVIAGKPEIDCTVVWPEFLPVNEAEETAALAFDLDKGLVSRQTAAGERGRDWEAERERIDDEKASEDNIGAALLRGFTHGGGGFAMNQNMNQNKNNRSNNNA